jgi:hypothetical protein
MSFGDTAAIVGGVGAGLGGAVATVAGIDSLLNSGSSDKDSATQAAKTGVDVGTELGDDAGSAVEEALSNPYSEQDLLARKSSITDANLTAEDINIQADDPSEIISDTTLPSNEQINQQLSDITSEKLTVDVPTALDEETNVTQADTATFTTTPIVNNEELNVAPSNTVDGEFSADADSTQLTTADSEQLVASNNLAADNSQHDVVNNESAGFGQSSNVDASTAQRNLAAGAATSSATGSATLADSERDGLGQNDSVGAGAAQPDLSAGAASNATDSAALADSERDGLGQNDSVGAGAVQPDLSAGAASSATDSAALADSERDGLGQNDSVGASVAQPDLSAGAASSATDSAALADSERDGLGQNDSVGAGAAQRDLSAGAASNATDSAALADSERDGLGRNGSAGISTARDSSIAAGFASTADQANFSSTAQFADANTDKFDQKNKLDSASLATGDTTQHFTSEDLSRSMASGGDPHFAANLSQSTPDLTAANLLDEEFATAQAGDMLYRSSSNPNYDAPFATAAAKQPSISHVGGQSSADQISHKIEQSNAALATAEQQMQAAADEASKEINSARQSLQTAQTELTQSTRDTMSGVLGPMEEMKQMTTDMASRSAAEIDAAQAQAKAAVDNAVAPLKDAQEEFNQAIVASQAKVNAATAAYQTQIASIQDSVLAPLQDAQAIYDGAMQKVTGVQTTISDALQHAQDTLLAPFNAAEAQINAAKSLYDTTIGSSVVKLQDTLATVTNPMNFINTQMIDSLSSYIPSSLLPAYNGLTQASTALQALSIASMTSLAGGMLASFYQGSSVYSMVSGGLSSTNQLQSNMAGNYDNLYGRYESINSTYQQMQPSNLQTWGASELNNAKSGLMQTATSPLGQFQSLSPTSALPAVPDVGLPATPEYPAISLADTVMPPTPTMDQMNMLPMEAAGAAAAGVSAAGGGSAPPVVSSASMWMCNKGNTLMGMGLTSPTTAARSVPIMTSKDMIPFANFIPMIPLCPALTKPPVIIPCVPALTPPKGDSKSVTQGGSTTLTMKSEFTCSLGGGKIKPTMTLATSVGAGG